MGLYIRLLKNSFKASFTFKTDYIISTLFSFVVIVLQISIWKALFTARNGLALNGIELNDMIAYNIISSFSGGITGCGVMYQINNMVANGEVGQRLLWPIGFRRYFFYSEISGNIFRTVYSTIPPCVIAILVYGLPFAFEAKFLPVYIISLLMAFVINFFLNFILGVTVFWMQNSFFLEWMSGALFSLFSGAFVPMWFFPGWLNDISRFLPFRYITFEPVAIVLGKYSMESSIQILVLQLVWILGLWLLGSLLWKRAQKKVFSQGG